MPTFSRARCRQPRKRFPDVKSILLCCGGRRGTAVSRISYMDTALPAATARRKFLARVVKAVHAAITATVGVIAGGAILSPVFGKREENWLTAASLLEVPEGRPLPVT